MSIQTRIIGAVMLVVAAVNIVYTVYFLGTERKNALQRLRATIEENEKLLRVVTAGPLYDGNIEQLDSTLDSFFSNPDMVGIELQEYNGNIRMYRTRTPGPLGEQISSRVVITRKMDELGEITTTYSTANIEQWLRSSRAQLILFSGILVLGLSGVIFVVARGLTGPIERLTAAARAMADGNLDQEVHAGSAQELQSLSQSFIRMRDAIREKMGDLAAQNEALRLKDMAMTSSINGIAIADPAGLLTYVNPAFLRLWGYGNEPQVLGSSLVDCWADRERAAQVLEGLRTGSGGIGELTARRNDGSLFDVEFSASVVKDEAGRIAYLMGSFVDITERKKAESEKALLESQLLQAQKMETVGRLAGGVAHDFNNMLSVILGYAALIKTRLPAGDPLVHYVEEILSAGTRSRDITGQLLAFSRKQIIAPRAVDLNGVIANTQNMIGRLIGEDIDLRFAPGKDTGTITFDPLQMEQLLINLAVNARDAMAEGGKLTLETSNVRLDEAYCRDHAGFVPGEYVLLQMSDTGVGMDKETLAHIFEPFFTTKEVGKGTGLGLATVYGIIKQNHGFINVYSEVGFGTTFKIYIPRALAAGAVAEQAEQAPIAFGSGTILLVEDDAMVRTMTTQMLEALGYSVLVAEGPQDALSLCERRETSVDLLMTDVIMPEMNGKELKRRIEAVRPGIRTLLMSGYTSDVIAHHGVLDEGIHFIQKPFNIEDLARKVRDAINGA